MDASRSAVDQDTRRAARRPGLPGDPAGAIYGTIVVAALLVAEGARHGVGSTVAAVAGTLVVFWLAHAYTDLLSGHITEGGGPGWAGFRHALRVQWPIVESGALPLGVLLGARALGAAPTTAVLAGLITCVVDLCGWSVVAARRMRLTPARAVPYVLSSALLGIGVIILKALLH